MAYPQAREWTVRDRVCHASVMCGRYAQSGDPSLIAEAFGATRENGAEEFVPSYNLAPTQRAPVVGLREGTRVIRVYRWGLIPSWAKDAKIAAQCINARSETVAEKPAFRAAFKKRRCLVPASGFFEWRREGRAKVPMYIHPVDGRFLAFAGLWEMWKDPAGEEVRTFTVITTPPNVVVAPIHDRMPAILPRAAWAAWLDANTPLEDLHALLVPAPAKLLEAYPVDPRVGSPTANDPAVLAPVHAA